MAPEIAIEFPEEYKRNEKDARHHSDRDDDNGSRRRSGTDGREGAEMQEVMKQNKAGSRIAAMDRPMPIEQHFDFEKPMRFTPVGPMGQHPPEISRAIHEESLEDQNYARDTGNDDDRRH